MKVIHVIILLFYIIKKINYFIAFYLLHTLCEEYLFNITYIDNLP